jgi:hypothetical protein
MLLCAHLKHVYISWTFFFWLNDPFSRATRPGMVPCEEKNRLNTHKYWNKSRAGILVALCHVEVFTSLLRSLFANDTDGSRDN